MPDQYAEILTEKFEQLLKKLESESDPEQRRCISNVIANKLTAAEHEIDAIGIEIVETK